MWRSDISQVEAVSVERIAAISSTYKSFSDYCFVYIGNKKKFYSNLLNPTALEKHPPKISCTGTIQINGQYVNTFDCRTVDYANCHTLLISAVVGISRFITTHHFICNIMQDKRILISKKPLVSFLYNDLVLLFKRGTAVRCYNTIML